MFVSVIGLPVAGSVQLGTMSTFCQVTTKSPLLFIATDLPESIDESRKKGVVQHLGPGGRHGHYWRE